MTTEEALEEARHWTVPSDRYNRQKLAEAFLRFAEKARKDEQRKFTTRWPSPPPIEMWEALEE